jgi:hypothetical protein
LGKSPWNFSKQPANIRAISMAHRRLPYRARGVLEVTVKVAWVASS